MKYLFTSIGLVFCYLLPAQCVMCKATAEQSDYASGINEGILYLMPLPALIIGVIAVVLYVNYKKRMKSQG